MSRQYKIQIYKNFNNENLITNWQNLYEKAGNYNLSHKWCKLWFDHFGKGKKLYIITLWNNEKLVLLAPFYIKNNRLFLIGTKPDLYDEFNVLYEKTEFLKKLFDFIDEKKFEINFKHVNSSTEIAKLLAKRISSNGIKTVSTVTETKPERIGEFNPKRKEKDDVKRCKNNAVKYFNDELKYEFNVSKEIGYIEEFIELHKQRWNGGMFLKKKNLDNFIKQIFLSCDFTFLSRLSLKNANKTVAYHLGFLDSSNNFYSVMPVYNTVYGKISPGKILLYELMTDLFNRGIKKFDFGRGSEPYKNWFSNHESVLFNIATYKNIIYYMKTKKIL
ncbi:MAG: GNAT family N-acetyltransferase [Candidatus Gastranaerophilales bacterium]|nr:GNAT family N-acetyltransferase [Candidatus Gastranaerophilales bacterium]